MSHRSQLDQGGYLIIPTTFEAAQEGSFTLRVYSSQAIKLKWVFLKIRYLKLKVLNVIADVYVDW